MEFGSGCPGSSVITLRGFILERTAIPAKLHISAAINEESESQYSKIFWRRRTRTDEESGPSKLDRREGH